MSEPFRPLGDAEFTADFTFSAEAMEALAFDVESTRRTIMVTNQFHYSRWYRVIIAILRFAYGWFGYKGPPRKYTTILPNMRITSVIEDERGVHVEARMESPDA